jgi:16S rRNA (guanine966-N2)-methyltransferase
MRITGGKARGVPIVAPRGPGVRPATDRMREAVFSSLGTMVSGRSFVDLFAGTGAYGLEALSRGAASGVFVERDRTAVACLRRNLAALVKSMGADAPVGTVVARDVFSWAPDSVRPVEIVFADPPYPMFPAIVSRLVWVFDAIGPSLCLLEAPGELELDLPGWRCVKMIGKGRGNPVCGFWERDMPEDRDPRRQLKDDPEERLPAAPTERRPPGNE